MPFSVFDISVQVVFGFHFYFFDIYLHWLTIADYKRIIQIEGVAEARGLVVYVKVQL